MRFQMLGDVAGRDGGTDAPSIEFALARINGSDPRPLFVVEDGKIYRAGYAVLREFRRGPHIDHFVEGHAQKIGY